jgi:hypothetical protein
VWTKRACHVRSVAWEHLVASLVTAFFDAACSQPCVAMAAWYWEVGVVSPCVCAWRVCACGVCLGLWRVVM